MPTQRRTKEAREHEEAEQPQPDAPLVAHAPKALAAVLEPLSAPVRTRTRLSPTLQFLLIVVLNSVLSSLGYVFLYQWRGGELTKIGKSLDTWVEAAALGSWRIAELGLAWFGNYDSVDLVALSLLSHGPPTYLIATFYQISPLTALLALAVDMLSTAIPFQLLRPLSEAHTGKTAGPNRELLTDLPIQILTTLSSAVIYGAVLFVAHRTYLPKTLVLYFDGLPSVAPVYSASYQSILPATIFFGIAAQLFIFAPYVATGKTSEDQALEKFDPASATLGETLAYNFRGFTTKSKVLIARTIIATVFTAINTYSYARLSIGGVEPQGALEYAAMWTVATALAGAGLAFIGGI